MQDNYHAGLKHLFYEVSDNQTKLRQITQNYTAIALNQKGPSPKLIFDVAEMYPGCIEAAKRPLFRAAWSFVM